VKNNYNRKLNVQTSKSLREKSNKEREELSKKFYLGEIIKKEKPKFGDNNLILAPVGSGKSFFIEENLIPENYSGKILYLTSNSSLKDSLAPNNNELREEFAKNNKSKGFFTSENKKRYGDVPYGVHVMTYHEFGLRIYSPHQTFTENIDLIFCDEIHSLPIFIQYGGHGELLLALNWLFQKHEGKTIYYFTATKESIEKLEEKAPGYLSKTLIFDYLNHPEIRKYQVKSTYYISNSFQLRVHLKAKLEYIKNNHHKGLAFTRKIESQKRIKEIAEEEGYNPITLWSINNEENPMNEEQLKVRDYILNTGNIPEPYNLLIINGSMQEGWNLFDNKVEFAILDTLDEIERVQALGRIRKDIDFLLLKVTSDDNRLNVIKIKEEFLNKSLTTEDKSLLLKDLNIKDKNDNIIKWPTAKKMISKSGYNIDDRVIRINDETKRVSILTLIKDIK